MLAWVMTACWVLRSRLTYFWRNKNISSILYFSKSTSINIQHSSLLDTLKMMLFTKYLMKMHWHNKLKISVLVWFKILCRIRYSKIDVILVQCPFNILFHVIVSDSPCSTNPCLNGATCLPLPSALPSPIGPEFLCVCTNGFTGERCEIPSGE